MRFVKYVSGENRFNTADQFDLRSQAQDRHWRIHSGEIGTIFVDATHAAKTGARTGAQTVVRGLLWGLSKRGADLQTMRWSKWRDGLLPLNRKQNERLGVVQRIESVRSKSPGGSWLVLPEI